MFVSLIAALTVDHVIGIENSIPWGRLSMDMKWFRYHTLNKPVVMGRKTFESIGKKPLKNRLNIVLSRILTDDCRGVCVMKNITQVLLFIDYLHYNGEVMIIGGGEIYSIFLSRAKRLYLTYVNDGNVYLNGDTWFPVYDVNQWKSIFNSFYPLDIKNNRCNLSFNIFERQ